MLIIKLILILALPLIFGYSALSLILKDKNDSMAPERFALAFGLGTSLITLEMLGLTKLGLAFNLFNILLPLIILTGIISAISLKLKYTFADFNGWKSVLKSIFSVRGINQLAEKLLLILIGLKIFQAFFEALVKPIEAWDSWSQYAFKAKMFYIEKTIKPEFLQAAGGVQHPLQIPLLETFSARILGSWNDALIKIIFPMYFVCLLIIFYSSLRRYFSKIHSLFFTFLLSTLPFLVFHAGSSYTDLPLAFYFFTGVAALMVWLRQPKTCFLAISFIFLFCSTLVKNEGIMLSSCVFGIFTLAVLFDRRLGAVKHIQQIRRVTLALAGLGGALLAFKVFFVPHEAICFGSVLIWDRIPAMAPIFLDRMFLTANWHLAWLLVILAVVFNLKKLFSSFTAYLFIIILLNLLGFGVYYFVSTDQIYSWLFDGTILSRNLLQFSPLLLLLSAELIMLTKPEIQAPQKTNKKR